MMSLIPRSSLFNFDDMLDGFFTPTQSESGKGLFAPRIDLKETDKAYEVSAELPGVKKEDIHLTLNNGILSIEAETKDESKEEKDGKVIRQERRYGKYVRSFNVGAGVRESDIKANFEDGILKVTAPKIQEQSPENRRIEIS